MTFLQLKGVEKQFGEVKTIKGIDLSIDRGQFTVFVGPVGLRQVDAAAPDRRAGDAQRRQHRTWTAATSRGCPRRSATWRWCSRATRCTRT